MRHLVTAGFLIAAAVFYVVGSALSVAVLIGMGVLAEGVFWFRLFGRRRKRNGPGGPTPPK
jgi:multisubunit Na+/H+ antiporter MnhC subunit